ncbi:WD40-repeat-containing domain protein [Zychaea mexicana]|uniref:WD40-repeat-containing domain protein n=1 Tax=Zychaea mexicana TaxID=64656 RepID=UPI0022FE5CD3|nr:WD40-repeat-containing domain protein [Zychaea mexicana]KAI9492531.1 WD40-repeat-containing domain protein [Zychaea mexicana]
MDQKQCVSSVSPQHPKIKRGHAYQFTDWIMDVCWLDSGELAVAFAHNQVEIYAIKQDNPSAVLVDRVQCQVRCILYSARFHGTTKENLLLASGTVFNEVHVWKITDRNEDNEGVVSHQLVGHEGVIFGVRFNPDGSMLTSVSDDRTIRIWPLQGERTNPLIIFGHTARVWDCQFVDQHLISISEDATCRVWKNTLVSKNEGDEDGDCLACWEGHIGKNVWSCAVSPEHKIVATGGQDSGIRLWSFVSIKNNNIESEDDLTLVELPAAAPSKPETFRNFCLTGLDTIVACSNEGRILRGDQKGAEWTILHSDPSYVKYAMMSPSPCGRLVIVGSIEGHLLLVSTDRIFEPIKLKVHETKIFEIFIENSRDPNVFYIVSIGFGEATYLHKLDATDPTTPVFETLYKLKEPTERTNMLSLKLVEETRLLICGSREGAMVVYELPLLSTTQHSGSEQQQPQTVNPLMQLRRTHGRQAISSVTLKHCDNNNNKEVVFWTTGRDGCYIQYRLVRNTNEQQQSSSTTTTSSANTAGKGDGSGKVEEKTKLGIASQGDTMIETSRWILEKIYRNKVTKGWLEGALWLNDELLLLGFYRKRFFVYNETKTFELVSIACGGAHRRWQFKTADTKLDLSTFTFVRKEQLFAYFRNESSVNGSFSSTVIQDNFHGRDVRAVRYLSSAVTNDPSFPLLFASAGEDTVLKFHQYIPSLNTKFATLSNVRKHTSVIKSIDTSKGIDTLLFTSGAREELYCWKLEVSKPPNMKDGDLLDLNCLEWAVCPAVSQVIETRIMDITVHAIDTAQGLHLVGAGYSDSTVRIWLFNEKTRQFSLIADGSWHRRCLLQMDHVVIPGSDNEKQDRILFFTGATDGRVAVWDISQKLRESIQDVAALEADPTHTAAKFDEPVYTYQPHQSGVNCLQVAYNPDENTLTIVTGGEDNALVAAKLALGGGKDDDDDAKIVVTAVGNPCSILEAHASSVTGTRLIQNNTAVLSTSTDQRLNMWTVKDLGSDGVALILVDASFVDVPDPSTMDTADYGGVTHAAIAGIGLESFSVSS